MDQIKIDRSFVSRMSTDDRAAAIVRASINLSADLGLTTVAEGIDDVGESHRRVWTAYREHYGRLASIPPTNVLCHELDLDDDCIDRLFKGPLNAWQSAGLPDPGEEARVYLDNQTHDDID